jgi:putative ATP-binding cassette transporter
MPSDLPIIEAVDAATDVAGVGDQRPHKRGTLSAYGRLAGGFWRGKTGKRAWGYTVGCGVMIVANIVVQYGINEWNRSFFNALDRKDGALVLEQTGVFAGLAVLATAVAVGSQMSRMRLQVDWRRWLTERLTRHWLAEQRFYRLSVSAPDLDSPEFRIAEDARVATWPVIDFGFGIANAVLMALVFLGILWSAAGTVSVSGVEIPGFMVLAAIAYSVVMTGSMMLFGRPLIARIDVKNSAEAKLRQDLGRVRENAETIAMTRGEGDETLSLRAGLQAVTMAWRKVISQLARMTVMINTNSVVAPVVPLLLAAPNYLNGTITLGGLMQTAAAFVQVQVALNWLVDNYAGIAEWLASVGRVVGLWTALGDLDATAGGQTHIEIGESTDRTITIQGLTVAQHDGLVVIDEADTVISPGERVLLAGASGTGKSTLIRAVAGLWPWGSGRVLLPAGARIAFLPQHAYLPPGSLRQVIEYPASVAPHSDEEMVAALRRCGLKRLASRLDDNERWDRVLSGGEQQRLAFARLLVQRPDIILMDGATAALDTASQEQMMALLRGDELSGCTVITVGQGPELEEFHDRTLTLTRRETGVQMSGGKPGGRLAGLLRRSLRPRPSPDSSSAVLR